MGRAAQRTGGSRRLSASRGRLSLLIAIAAIAFHLLGSALIARESSFPTSLDDLQHLSFIRTMEQRPQLFPAYERMRTLDPAGRNWTAVPNYLNHPSPYYLAMGPADRALGGSILGLRLVDAVLSAAGIALMLLGGFSLLQGVAARATFAAFLVLFPKLAVISGIINNDNAALLATGVTVLGLAGWQRRGRTRDAALLALGLAMAGWSKLTVFLMLGFGAAFAELLRWRDRERGSLAGYGLLALGGAVGSIPTLVNFSRYGRALFHAMTFYTPPAQRVPIGFPAYARLFLRQMADGWSATDPAPLMFRLGLLLVLLIGAATLALGWPRRAGPADEAPAWRTAGGLILALVPVLAIHLWFGWQAVVEDGFTGMAQARYYYGLWPGFALGAGWLAAHGPRSPAKAAALGVTAVLLLLSSGAFLAAMTALRGGGPLG